MKHPNLAIDCVKTEAMGSKTSKPLVIWLISLKLIRQNLSSRNCQ